MSENLSIEELNANGEKLIIEFVTKNPKRVKVVYNEDKKLYNVYLKIAGTNEYPEMIKLRDYINYTTCEEFQTFEEAKAISSNIIKLIVNEETFNKFIESADSVIDEDTDELLKLSIKFSKIICKKARIVTPKEMEKITDLYNTVYDEVSDLGNKISIKILSNEAKYAIECIKHEIKLNPGLRKAINESSDQCTKLVFTGSKIFNPAASNNSGSTSPDDSSKITVYVLSNPQQKGISGQEDYVEWTVVGKLKLNAGVKWNDTAFHNAVNACKPSSSELEFGVFNLRMNESSGGNNMYQDDGTLGGKLPVFTFDDGTKVGDKIDTRNCRVTTGDYYGVFGYGGSEYQTYYSDYNKYSDMESHTIYCPNNQQQYVVDSMVMDGTIVIV